MKVYIPNVSKTEIGGGWTFLRNLKKASEKLDDLEIVNSSETPDVLFAFSPTTIDGETIQKYKAKGIPFVLRLDGVPEDSRNSGKGTRRLVEYAKEADYIVYQTRFVQETLGKILHNLGVEAPGKVVYNGVDTEVFTPKGPKMPFEGKLKILHVNYRKDNNKRVEEVVQMYRELWTERHDTNLILMGRYPTEWVQYGMGLFAGEKYQTVGVVTDEKYKAMIMRSCDVLFYPSYADPAPNVVLEAMASGLPIIYNWYGGVAEMVHGIKMGNYPISYTPKYADLIDLATHPDNINQNRRLAETQFSLENMVVNYRDVFKMALEIKT